MNYYAHTAEDAEGHRDPNESHWQLLKVHLRPVAHENHELPMALRAMLDQLLSFSNK